MQRTLTYSVFFISGAAALVYQVVWVRQLSLVFGASHLAVSTVLAVFMGGIALGGYLAARYAGKILNGLRTYAQLEFGIALGAFLFHLYLNIYPQLYTFMAALAPSSPVYLTVVRALLTAVALLPITTMMGATLPILVEYCVGKKEQIGSRLSALYAINTVGAVAGVIIAGFVLLPATNVSTTIIFAFVMNLVAAGSAWILSKWNTGHTTTEKEQSTAGTRAAIKEIPLANYVLLATAVSGFCALAYEVLWTRILIVTIVATDYVFSSILAAFLVGIGSGAAIYNRHKSRLQDSGISAHQLLGSLGAAHIAIGALISLSVVGLYQLPTFYVALTAIFQSVGLDNFHARQLANLAVAFIYLGLPAIIMGISFPLAGEVLGRYRKTPASAVGQLAATNTIGALFGALVAGFVLIQTVGFERSIHLVILLNITCGVLLVARAANRKLLVISSPVAGVVIAVAAIANPGMLRAWDQHLFAVYQSDNPQLAYSNDIIEQVLKNYKILYYGEGSSSIVSAAELEGIKIFSTNGRVEATSHLQDRLNQLALAHLPMLLHPDPKQVLVVGGGSGMTLGSISIYPSLERVVLAEIEPEVLGVINAFSDLNHDVLNNERLEVVLNDGRNYLLTADRERFDVITSDPIHPLFRGTGYLYTREYFTLASERMNRGGIMAQWLPLYQMDNNHIKSVIASFSAAFKHTSIWLLYTDAVLVGSNEPMAIDLERIDNIQERSPVLNQDLKSVNMGGAAENLISYFLAGDIGTEKISADAIINTDDNLYLEFSTPKASKDTDADNILLLSKARESSIKYLKSSNIERVNNWSRLESNHTMDMLDKVHYAAITKQTNTPKVQKYKHDLSASQDLGRWQTLLNFLPD